VANPAPVLSAADAAPEPFSLDTAIRDLYERTQIADPGAFADALLDGLPMEHVREVARRSLREFVRVWFSRERLRSAALAPVANGPAPSGKPNARFAGLVEALLRERLHVSEKGWKEFRDCGLDDLVFVITERRQNAARSLAKAGFYERVHEEVAKAGVERVGDLPRDVLSALATRGDEP